MKLLSDPISTIKEAITRAFSRDTLETAFHGGLGFGATAVGSRLIYKSLFPALGETNVGRVVTHFGASILSGVVIGMLGGPVIGARAVAGGMLATLWQIVSEAVKDTDAAKFIPTLGQDAETAEFRKAIEHEVLRELRGGGGGMQDHDGLSTYLQPAGISQIYLQPAGQETYLTQREAESADRGLSAYMTERESLDAGVGDEWSEFGSKSMAERF
jgi:hypothetical protein